MRTVIRHRQLAARVIAKRQHALIRVDIVDFTETASTFRKPVGNPAPLYRACPVCCCEISVGRLLLFRAGGTGDDQGRCNPERPQEHGLSG